MKVGGVAFELMIDDFLCVSASLREGIMPFVLCGSRVKGDFPRGLKNPPYLLC